MGRVNEILDMTLSDIVNELYELSDDLRRNKHEPLQANGVDKAIEIVKVHMSPKN